MSVRIAMGALAAGDCRWRHLAWNAWRDARARARSSVLWRQWMVLALTAGLWACGGDSATSPSAGFVTSPEGTGIVGVTAFTFTASAPNVASPTYAWDFGDGSGGSGSVATHVYASEGTFSVTLRVTGPGGEATASARIAVGSLTGRWSSRAGSDGVWHELRVVQQGASIRGQWTVHIEPGSPWYVPGGANRDTSLLRGTLESPRTVALSQGGECRRSITGGSVNAALTEMGGGRRSYGLAECGPRSSPYPGWLFYRD